MKTTYNPKEEVFYLKTLKEVKRVWEDDNEPYLENFASIKELRQQAVRWIKVLKDENFKGWKEEKKYRFANDILITWIKYFFVITKEDLKNEDEN